MNRAKVRKLLKFKTKSTTDLSMWNKNDEKLLKAVESSDLKKVNSILSKKTLVPNKLGPRGHSVFQIACASGNDEIVEALLKYTDDVNDLTIQGNTALQLAAAKGHTGIVQQLLQANVDVDMKDSNNMTALHHACAGLHLHCVQALLHGNASPKTTEKTGKTSLFYAAHRGDINICRLLQEKGADVNTQDIYQVTSLMIAAKEGHREVCDFLLRKGANSQSMDKEGKIALVYAINAGHGELRDVFAKAPTRASCNVPVFNEREIRYPEHIKKQEENQANSVHNEIKADMVSKFRESPAPEVTNDVKELPVHPDISEDLKKTSSAPNLLKITQASPLPENDNINKKLQELQEEHDQLNEEYHKLSILNLKLQDKLEFSKQRLAQQTDQEKDIQSEDMKLEISNLKQILESEKEKTQELRKIIEEKQKTSPVLQKLRDDGWPDSDEESAGDCKVNEDKKTVVLLRSQMLTLNNENDQLKEKLQNLLPNGYLGNESDKSIMDQISTSVSLKDLEDLNDQIQTLESEKQELQTQMLELKETTEMEKLNSAIIHEEIISQNKHLEEKLGLLESMQNGNIDLSEQSDETIDDKSQQKEELIESTSGELKIKGLIEEIDALQHLLEQYKISNQELCDENLNLKEVLNKNITNKTDINDDKSEFIQELTSVKQEVIMLKSMTPSSRTESDDSGEVEPLAQKPIEERNEIERLENHNEKLQDQVTMLSTELNKLRTTFDAILKAGDDLQEDFDQLQQEKERIQLEYEKLLEVREEFSKENTYLLQDGNQMHEDLTKLVYELENLQEKYKTVVAEKKDLEIKISAVNLAGKVGEVATLLEEKDKVQQKFEELEERSSTLQHDHDIILEEVPILQEQISQLTTQRDQMFEDLDDYEACMQQHDILQQDYNQLEQDFTVLIKEKDKLEHELLEVQTSNIRIEQTSVTETSEELIEQTNNLLFEKEQLELTIDELSKANALLEEEILVMKKVAPDISIQQKLNNNDSDQDEEHKHQIKSLQSQISFLQTQLDENGRSHREAVSMYRTHLVSAVQGHMDPDVHQALNNIIEIRSMEQFC